MRTVVAPLAPADLNNFLTPIAPHLTPSLQRKAYAGCSKTLSEAMVMDVVYAAAMIVLFGLMVGLVLGCAKLGGPQ
jgi:hypothetical protein